MKIWRVTFTGADDDTSIDEMIKLSHEYKHLEWGILFSQSKSGVARYPSPQWVDELHNLAKMHIRPSAINSAAHLCGKWVEQALNGSFTFNDNRFSRIQLNCGSARLREAIDSPKLVQASAEIFGRNLRLQSIILGGNYSGVIVVPSSKYQFLFDTSGGTGKVSKSYPELFESESCGYAGGLNSDNLEEELNKMSLVAGDRHIWIDMESSLRDKSDKFDLTKIEQIMDIVKPWLL